MSSNRARARNHFSFDSPHKCSRSTVAHGNEDDNSLTLPKSEIHKISPRSYSFIGCEKTNK